MRSDRGPSGPARVEWAEQFHSSEEDHCRFRSWKCYSGGRPYSAFLETVLRQVAEGKTSHAILTLKSGQNVIVRKKPLRMGLVYFRKSHWGKPFGLDLYVTDQFGKSLAPFCSDPRDACRFTFEEFKSIKDRFKIHDWQWFFKHEEPSK